MAKKNFVWDKVVKDDEPKPAAPTIILSVGAIRIEEAAVAMLPSVDRVVIGYSADDKSIGIKEYVDGEGNQPYEFASKVKNGAVTIRCAKFLENAYSNMGVKIEGKQKIKCAVSYDGKSKVLSAEIPEAKENTQQSE